MNQRYFSLSEYFRNNYHDKVYKLSINAGFTCPNRENGNRGCLFCSDFGSGEFGGNIENSITKQIEEQKEFLKNRKNAKKFIAYFQSFTNTYAPVEKLRSLYYEALNCEDIIGIAIATRPDCLSEEVLDLLSEINEKYFLWVELGFQTAKEDTGNIIRRGYNNDVFSDAVSKLNERNIKVVSHIIFGLPFEDRDDNIKTVKYIKDLGLWGLKIHSLFIYEDSDLKDYYMENKFPLLEKDEYIKTVCDALEMLPEDLVIHRLTGDGEKSRMVYPDWSKDKLSVIGGIQKELKIRDAYQGKHYTSN